MDRQKTIKQ